MNNIKDTILGLLFYESDAITATDICELLNITKEEALNALNEIKQDYSDNTKSLVLLNQNDSYQMVLSGEARNIIISRDNKDREGELSRAALETLACILYLGSASKSQIDYIRGVQSSYILRTLAARGLIARSGKSGRDTIYTATVETLRFMGIDSREEMPDFDKISSEFKNAILTNNNE